MRERAFRSWTQKWPVCSTLKIVRERAFRSWTQKWPVCSPSVVRERAFRSWTQTWPDCSANVVRERAFWSWTQQWPVCTTCSTHVVRERAFRSWTQKRPVCSTNVVGSYETSSRSEAPSLQNERFVRDFLQKWGAKSPKRALTCISRLRHARSPQRVAPDKSKTRSHLHFAPSTRTTSAEGCAGQGQNAISPAFRALDAHDLRRGLPATNPKRNLTYISCPRRARSPQRIALDRANTHSHLHFAPWTRTTSAEGCTGQIQNAISPAFRAPSTHDLRRGLRRTAKTQSHLHFAPSTRAISSEGCVSWSSGGTAPGLKRESK